MAASFACGSIEEKAWPNRVTKSSPLFFCISNAWAIACLKVASSLLAAKFLIISTVETSRVTFMPPCRSRPLLICFLRTSEVLYPKKVSPAIDFLYWSADSVKIESWLLAFNAELTRSAESNLLCANS